MKSFKTPIADAFKKYWEPGDMTRAATNTIKAVEQRCLLASMLVDDVFEIVELWNPSTPSQAKWKQEWLESARKLGAGPDW